MKWEIAKALILSPHTDDMELGAGATIRKLVENGVQVKSIVFSDCKKSVDTSKYPIDVLRKECKAASGHLGIDDPTILEFPVREFPKYRQEIEEEIYKLRETMKPDLVIAPWSKDLHQDHRTVGEEAIRAFMRLSINLWAYQLPGTCFGFIPQVFIPVSDDEVDKKIEMLHRYQSQVERRDYFRPEKIRAFLSQVGSFINSDYAEGFANVRLVFNDVA